MQVVLCKRADKEHEQSIRQYAHTQHYKETICLSQAFYKLPLELKVGIILHEIGHLLGEKNERRADEVIEEIFGISIHRVDTRYGKNLESI